MAEFSSRDVLPCGARFDVAHRPSRQVEGFRERRVTGRGLSDVAHALLGQMSEWVIFAAALATLLPHVVHIILRATDEKVRGVYAGWVVTSVANELTRRQGAVHLFPDVARKASGFLSVRCKDGVPVSTLGAEPFDAAIREWFRVTKNSFLVRLMHSSALVPFQVRNMLPFNMAPSPVGVLGNTGYLPAPTFAQHRVDSDFSSYEILPYLTTRGKVI